jgi:WXG100 family type VII secretion target
MAFEGMDVDAVLQSASQLQREGDAIVQVINAVNGVIGHLPGVWKGQDATEFEGWWNNQHRPALQQAADAIHGLAQSARNNAQAQQSTSAS